MENLFHYVYFFLYIYDLYFIEKMRFLPFNVQLTFTYRQKEFDSVKYYDQIFQARAK